MLAWNRQTGEFRSGQVKVDEGYEHWLLKFDGVSNNRDKELADPQGFGKIEYAYHLIATAAGIDMSECRLHHEGGRSHFMTRRFDRDGRGRKLHMQSLGAIQHFDFNDPASYSYEQAALTIRDLGLGMDVVEQQVRRAIFNVVARNQDDHVKNISFLMDRSGTWCLSPAYDVAYSYNPSGVWTRDHQMSLAGKRNDFTYGDLMAFASNVGVKAVRAKRTIEEVVEAVCRWRAFAEDAGVDPSDMSRIEKTFRMTLRGK
ncbi:MAG: HipA domain-containing protein [Loktanella sp.]|nr:HipA domain-containing protein [Loktanella sp.]